jgi:lipopolysaccharide transport system ATP-binding protein
MTGMTASSVAVTARGLGKSYLVYERPQDRLKQMLWRGRRTYYREFWALRDVSFDARHGETLGIIGRNGSGKSTLLKMLTGTLRPTTGEMAVCGRAAALLELGSGFNPEFSGRENVYMNASILGLSEDEIDERFEAIEAFADIGDFLEQPVRTYSSGMCLRLAFAVIAHVDADILIIDEALAVGDVFFVQKCMRFLREFREHGSLLFASHDTAAVLGLCDRALLLDHGRLKHQGPAKEVCDLYLASVRQAQAGREARVAPPAPAFTPTQVVDDGWDQRLKYVNCTPFRNDIEVVPFISQPPIAGAGGAQIVGVYLEDEEGRLLSWVVGGEIVSLVVRARTVQDIDLPIVGFLVKDRLGQNLFGDNTFLTYAGRFLKARGGEMLTARFCFRIPVLPPGDYTVDAAVAEGTQAQHVIHCWNHDVLAFKSHSSSVHQGLIGIPMRRIALQVGEAISEVVVKQPQHAC